MGRTAGLAKSVTPLARPGAGRSRGSNTDRGTYRHGTHPI